MSDPDPAVADALRWLRYSTEDLDVARVLLASSPLVPRHVCWLAQQSAEKALKAALVLEGVAFPFTHDLDALCNRLPGPGRLVQFTPISRSLPSGRWRPGTRATGPG